MVRIYEYVSGWCDMDKFTKKLYGYDPKQVKSYLDNITSQVENMVTQLKKKDEEIVRLKNHMMNNITTSEEKMKELRKLGKTDVYYKSLVYTLSICETTREHFNEIFNIRKSEVN